MAKSSSTSFIVDSGVCQALCAMRGSTSGPRAHRFSIDFSPVQATITMDWETLYSELPAGLSITAASFNSAH
jgi:hypothetical protein